LAEFQNPQQDPGTERRLLLVFLLTFIVLIGSQTLLKKFFPQATAPAATSQNQATPQRLQAESSSPASAVAPPANLPAASSAPARAASETETVVENDLYRITFTNRGALAKSWILKKYKDDHGQPLELIHSQAAAKYGYPLSLWTYDEAQRSRLNGALYVVSAVGRLEGNDLSFQYSDQGFAVRKTFHFDESYVIHIETSAALNGAFFAALPVWPAGLGDETSLAAYHASQFEYQFNDKIERLAIKKISSGNTLHGPFNWVGITDQYFAAVFLPDDPQSVSAITLRNAIDVPKDPQKPNPQENTPVEVLGAAVGNLSGPTDIELFVGPKALQVLESVKIPALVGASPDLRALVDFGWLNLISRPLFLWLKWTHNYVPNWGWAICLQTLIINVALLPLRVSSMKSALKMQRIQPQMNSIKEKYKKYGMRDPRRQEMNTEIGELMKREGVSPVGGCLPLLIQMPFLFAYYRMLAVAIDLRQAPWLWIHDLSSRDPFFILPVMLVVSMLLTQRMTPQAGMDPAQQKMMAWTMPLMMGFIFFNLAAGLNLYYAEGNLISIAQQAIMNRTKLGQEMREIALKRARKKDK
jgi:YidC/Oxa1 family membrane protein insertase